MKKKKIKAQKKVSAPPIKKKASGIPIINNILVLFLFILILVLAKKNNTGYTWMVDSLILSNLELINKNPDWTFDQRLEAKNGFNLTYLNHVKKNTPEDAMILFPPKDKILAKGDKKPEFSKNMTRRTWVTYFLYPRKVLYEGDKEVEDKKEQITHIAILNGSGYNNLPYEVSNKQKHTILPIKQN